MAEWPWRGVLVLSLGNCAHFYSICSLFSYAGFLCVDLGWVSNKDRAGFLAGWLGTSLTVGRLPTAVAWGVAIDRWGRRPCLLACFISIAVGNVAFGFCRNVWCALAVRFAFLGMGNGWVTIAGTMSGEIAGSARQNEVTAKMMAAGSVVQLVGPAVAATLYGLGPREYPAMAPSLFGAAFALFVFVLGLFWLPETHHRHEEEAKEAIDADCVAERDDEDDSSPALCKNRNFLVSTYLRFATGTCLFAMFDVLPLWAISSRESGGLELSMTKLATVLTLAAVGQCVYNYAIMFRILQRSGQRVAIRYAAVVAATAAIAIPLVGSAATTKYFLCLTPFVMAYYSAGATSFTAVSATLNNAVSDTSRGSANGIATMVEAVGKAAGPTLGATAFAYSIKTHPGAVGASSTFFAIAAILSTCSVATFILDSGVENEKRSATAVVVRDHRKVPNVDEQENPLHFELVAKEAFSLQDQESIVAAAAAAIEEEGEEDDCEDPRFDEDGDRRDVVDELLLPHAKQQEENQNSQ